MLLSASKRISLLKEISARLQKEEWSLIDITMSQFGLPTTNTWNGDKYDYVLEMSKGGSDSVLIELAQHVGYLIEEVPKPGIDPPFWRKRMFRLFVTHLSAEKVLAAQLQEALLNYGISGFVAHNDIEPTLEWQSQIETALATADSLVALLHPEFHESNWTDQEIGFAMEGACLSLRLDLAKIRMDSLEDFRVSQATARLRILAHESLMGIARTSRHRSGWVRCY